MQAVFLPLSLSIIMKSRSKRKLLSCYKVLKSFIACFRHDEDRGVSQPNFRASCHGLSYPSNSLMEAS